MTSQTGQQIIRMLILPNILRNEDNQTMKINKSNKKNMFLEKSYTKCIREATPKPFYKKSKLSISLDQ